MAYIPLDNRPVNKDRVEYLAQSVGIKLLMPEEHLYRTALDNMAPNPDGSTIGNRQALLDWIREADKTCDHFIISLDQMLSGGLVGSRWLNNTDLTFEYEVADEIIRLCKNNTVYLFDTVMRLASTVNYGGYQMEEYTQLRTYGQVARKQLSGADLTVDNIIAGYRFDQNGKKVSTGKEGAFTSGKTVTARLQNFDVENYGETPVYGQVYLVLKNDTTIESAVYSYNFRTLVEQIAKDSGDYTESQLSALRNMLSQFEDTVSGWDIDGIM